MRVAGFKNKYKGMEESVLQCIFSSSGSNNPPKS